MTKKLDIARLERLRQEAQSAYDNAPIPSGEDRAAGKKSSEEQLSETLMDLIDMLIEAQS